MEQGNRSRNRYLSDLSGYGHIIESHKTGRTAIIAAKANAEHKMGVVTCIEVGRKVDAYISPSAIGKRRFGDRVEFMTCRFPRTATIDTIIVECLERSLIAVRRLERKVDRNIFSIDRRNIHP